MNRTIFSSVLTAVLFAQSLGQTFDISGWKLIQANASGTYVVPNGTSIEAGGYVIIARNASRSAFETFWGVTLVANVVFLNTSDASGVAPKINGSETFELQNSSSVNQDGPTISMPGTLSGRTVFQRRAASDPAGSAGSWNTGTTSSPGSGMTSTNTSKVIISEFADDAGTGNFIYEFVELFYDATPVEKGQGLGSFFPSRWRYNVPTDIQFVFKPQSDTLRGFRFVKPGPVIWNDANLSIQPAATISHDGDTTMVTNITLSGTDSIVATITGVTASDTTDEFIFDIRSSMNGTTFLPIQIQPKTLVIGDPRPMSAVKRKETNGVHSLLGRWVVVRGVVTAANEFSGPSYLQDPTAGIAVFDSSVSNNVARGDEVILLGVVAPFNELFELTPCSIIEKISEGNPVDTLVLTAAQVTAQTASEPHEGRLMRINNVTVNTTAWNATGSGSNYMLTDPTGQLQIRISSRVNLVGLPVPTGQFDVVGVLGQFSTNYQILPRSYHDIIVEGQGPRIISQAPFESAITPTSLTFTWQTDNAGTSTVRYGTTKAYGNQVTDTNKVTQHQVTVTGLKSATVYNVQLESSNSAGTTTTANYVASTSSQNSAGTINVYFNKSVNTTVAQGENAQGVINLAQKLIERINAAAHSVDVCLYSLSGNVGANVAQALINAKNRGVNVRVIGEKDNQNTAPWTTLKNGGITVIDDGYDTTNAGAGLMHNKFLVFDNRDVTSETDDWVWTGSWNTTDPGTNDDFQNAIEIQDKALANAYTLEFNEMWGSDSLAANAMNSRFGARKLENTPHYFLINGTSVELYFSPSDRTTNQIIRTINKTQYSVNFALLTFTRTDIGNALVTKKNAGRKVRGIMDNRTDQGSQFDSLLARGVDVLLDVNSAFLHHKYGIIDAETTSPLQYTITGSHNWSSSAENSNNENTVIIESRRIANLYLQEFKARYLESGGTDNIVVSVEHIQNDQPTTFALSQNYPNPFNPTTNFEVRVANSSFVILKIFDVLGREVATLMNEKRPAGEYLVIWDASSLPSGVYFSRMQAGNFVQTRKIIIAK